MEELLADSTNYWFLIHFFRIVLSIIVGPDRANPQRIRAFRVIISNHNKRFTHYADGDGSDFYPFVRYCFGSMTLVGESINWWQKLETFHSYVRRLVHPNGLDPSNWFSSYVLFHRSQRRIRMIHGNKCVWNDFQLCVRRRRQRSMWNWFHQMASWPYFSTGGERNWMNHNSHEQKAFLYETYFS